MAALAPTPLSMLPVAADVEENALAPMLSDAAAAVLVPMPVADPHVTAEDAADAFVTRTLASPPPEQKVATESAPLSKALDFAG
jgi:hypothetical protein